NGVGTAPPDVFCPAAAWIVAGAACGPLELCGACGTCDAPRACDADADAAEIESTIFLYCAGGTGATWTCVNAGDGGTFADADAGSESEVDGDASDADVEGDVD